MAQVRTLWASIAFWLFACCLLLAGFQIGHFLFVAFLLGFIGKCPFVFSVLLATTRVNDNLLQFKSPVFLVRFLFLNLQKVQKRNDWRRFVRHYTDSNRGFKSQSLAC